MLYNIILFLIQNLLFLVTKIKRHFNIRQQPAQPSFQEIMTDANKLIHSFNMSKKGCTWKASIQDYEINLLDYIYKAQEKIKKHDYNQRPFNEFIHTDRGKIRLIKAVNIHDRVLLRNLCDYILVPAVEKYYIYDNGASVKNKGIFFTRNRLITHLKRFYKKHGSDGYILLIDFSKFFDNIPHDKLINLFSKYISDVDTIEFLKASITAFKIDVSYMNEKEYNNCYNNVFNSIEYHKISHKQKTGQKFMYKSVGIGSQVSQIAGLLYPTQIDNYCKIIKGLKYYGRYMDDIYVIHQDKKFLQELLKDLEKISKELGIFINPHKTQIIKLSKGFCFLKIKYKFSDTGHIIRKINSTTITRERRKLKRMKKLLGVKANFSFEDIQNSFNSFLGNLKHFDTYYQKTQMEQFFNNLFKEELLIER